MQGFFERITLDPRATDEEKSIAKGAIAEMEKGNETANAAVSSILKTEHNSKTFPDPQARKEKISVSKSSNADSLLDLADKEAPDVDAGQLSNISPSRPGQVANKDREPSRRN